HFRANGALLGLPDLLLQLANTGFRGLCSTAESGQLVAEQFDGSLEVGERTSRRLGCLRGGSIRYVGGHPAPLPGSSTVAHDAPRSPYPATCARNDAAPDARRDYGAPTVLLRRETHRRASRTPEGRQASAGWCPRPLLPI